MDHDEDDFDKLIEKHKTTLDLLAIAKPVLSEELWQAIKARMELEGMIPRRQPNYVPVYNPNAVDPNSTTGQRMVF